MDSNLCYLTVKHILGLPAFRTPRNCSVGCPVTWLANGICENECNVADCGYDALDCDDGTFADKVGSLRLSSWDLTVTLSTSSQMSVKLAKRYSFQLGRYLPAQKFSMVVSCLHIESVILILPCSLLLGCACSKFHLPGSLLQGASGWHLPILLC